jgi:2-dehydro-3-deoxyphosphogluconate aldolase/(4S)-4-hydroxy-2-oxoglutarate aldolase
MEQERIIDRIEQQGFLPLFYHADVDVCIAVVDTLYKSGVRIVEFTNRGENALKNFSELSKLRSSQWKDLLLAAGTIRSGEQADSFIAAGADFLISPVFDPAVSDAAYLQKILWIPGCMTPTEIHVAEQAGCKLVKIFPGNLLGPAFVSAVKESFPEMRFMPTGGVDSTEENIAAWFNSGVIAVGMGSRLIGKQLLETKDFEQLKRLASEAVSLVARARTGKTK